MVPSTVKYKADGMIHIVGGGWWMADNVWQPESWHYLISKSYSSVEFSPHNEISPRISVMVLTITVLDSERNVDNWILGRVDYWLRF